MRNMSPEGAKLVLESTIWVPDSFELLVHDGTKHNCKVIWRKMGELGVHYL